MRTGTQRAERTNLLIQAIDNGNVEQAKACIKLGADVNATVRKYGNTLPLLIYAIDKGNKEIAELLIQAGADVNKKLDDGTTLLMCTLLAADKGFKDAELFAELLIKAGADVNAKASGEYNGYTALMFAAKEGGNSKIAELLIKAGADVNAKTDDGKTALIEAAEYKHIEIIELLIKAGAVVHAKSDTSDTTLIGAINDSIHVRNPRMTETEIANAKTASRLTAELLVKAGADIDTLFIDTIKHRINDTVTTNNVSEPYLNKAMVKLFIDLGANVNATDNEGISVLTYAALYGRNDITEALKAAGARE